MLKTEQSTSRWRLICGQSMSEIGGGRLAYVIDITNNLEMKRARLVDNFFWRQPGLYFILIN